MRNLFSDVELTPIRKQAAALTMMMQHSEMVGCETDTRGACMARGEGRACARRCSIYVLHQTHARKRHAVRVSMHARAT